MFLCVKEQGKFVHLMFLHRKLELVVFLNAKEKINTQKKQVHAKCVINEMQHFEVTTNKHTSIFMQKYVQIVYISLFN